MHWIKRMFKFSNLMACFAVFLALGGAAFAVSKAPKNSVVSPSIKNGTVNGKDVKNESLTGADINESSLALGDETRPTGPAGGDLAGTYPNPTIGPNAVGSAEVANGSITGADVGDDSLDGFDIKGLSFADLQADTLTGGQINESTLNAVPTATQGGVGRYGFEGECDPETGSYEPCSSTQITLDKPGRLLIDAGLEIEPEAGEEYGFGRCQITTSTGAIGASNTRAYVVKTGIEQMSLSAVSDVLPAGTYDAGIECNELKNNQTDNAIFFPQARVTVVGLSAG